MTANPHLTRTQLTTVILLGLWLTATTSACFAPYATISIAGQAYKVQLISTYPAQALLILFWLLALAQWWMVHKLRSRKLLMAWVAVSALHLCHLSSIYYGISTLFPSNLQSSLAEKTQAFANFRAGFYVYGFAAAGTVFLAIVFSKLQFGIPAKIGTP